LEKVAQIWRGGCIIRAGLLEDIRMAYESDSGLPNLLVDPNVRQQLMIRQADWRAVMAEAALAGIPTPGLAASLGYFDAYRRARLPANLIQAQRDYFGAHTYERVDAPGAFHTDWHEETGEG
jgi:6-phosphogluconate dehydrogenase